MEKKEREGDKERKREKERAMGWDSERNTDRQKGKVEDDNKDRDKRVGGRQTPKRQEGTDARLGLCCGGQWGSGFPLTNT